MTKKEFQEFQQKNFIRLSLDSIDLVYVSTKLKATRLRRGGFRFKTTLKEIKEDESIEKRNVNIKYTPLRSESFLDNIFVGEGGLATYLISGKKRYGRCYIEDETQLALDAIVFMKNLIINAFRDTSKFTLKSNGVLFYKDSDEKDNSTGMFEASFET